MKISFLGAAREVTGSCHLIECGGLRILIDCGLQQGKDEKDSQALPFAAETIDWVLLTHAHIDHSGRLPLLYKCGFKGKVLTTRASFELCKIMLKDSAHIQENEAEYENKKRSRSGKKEIEPLYNLSHAEGILSCFEYTDYNIVRALTDNIKVRFLDAGHLLGSASIEVTLCEGSQTRKLHFSGDIGNNDQPLISDPNHPEGADFVIMETTYGNREHSTPIDYVAEFAKIIDTTLARGGTVVIPSFAVGRTQELLYHIREIKQRKLVQSIPNFSVYVDSPLGIEATNIYENSAIKYFDDQAKHLIAQGINPIKFDGLFIALSTDESKALNDGQPKVIISSSGMCEAGRIRHHLKHNLWKATSTVVFVGYQAIGTLGRQILEGAKTVKLFKEQVQIKAQIIQLEGMSAHADRSMLFDWVGGISGVGAIFLVHGEDLAIDAFADLCTTQTKSKVFTPSYLETYDLISGTRVADFDAIVTPKVKNAGLLNSVLADTELLTAELSKKSGLCNSELRKISKTILDLIKSLE